MGYDPIEVNQAAKQAVRAVRKNGGAGYTEKHEYRLGSIDGKTKIEFESVPLYKVSGKIPDINSFIRCSGILGGEERNFTIESFTVVDLGRNFFMGIAANEPIGAVVYSDESGFETGVYLTYFDEENRTTYIEFAETIHPIDPKYLPGVCLPVVELSTVATAEGANLTAEESARMDEVAAMGVPMVLKVASVNDWYSVVCQAIGPRDGNILGFAVQAGENIIAVVNQENGWIVTIA